MELKEKISTLLALGYTASDDNNVFTSADKTRRYTMTDLMFRWESVQQTMAAMPKVYICRHGYHAGESVVGTFDVVYGVYNANIQGYVELENPFGYEAHICQVDILTGRETIERECKYSFDQKKHVEVMY